MLESMRLDKILREPTHFSELGSTLIDVLCTDIRTLQVHSKDTPDLRRHAMIVAVLKIKKEKPSPQSITYRPLRDILADQFSRGLDAVDWEYFYKSGNATDLARTFTCWITAVFDLHAPVKSQKFRNPHHPWITDSIKEMMRIRDRYHSQYKLMRTKVLR
jgi:hypothetical protein